MLKRHKMVAGFLAAVTTLSPMVSVMPVFAAKSNAGIGGISNTDTTTDVTSNSNVAIQSEDGKSAIVVGDDDMQVAQTLSLDVLSGDGEVVVTKADDAEGESERHIRVSEDSEGKKVASVTDKDNVLLSQTEITQAEPYSFVFTAEVGTTYHVRAVADTGFDVSTYRLLIDSGTHKGAMESIANFASHAFVAFNYDVTLDADKIVTIDFGATDSDSIVVGDTVDDSIKDSGADVVDGGSGVGISVGDTVSDDDAEHTDDTKSDEDTPTEDTDVPEDMFLSGDYDVSALAPDDFASRRLILQVDDVSKIVDAAHIIGQYGGLYLLQYTTVEQAMNAYVYYTDASVLVEPDIAVHTVKKEDIVVSLDSSDGVAIASGAAIEGAVVVDDDGGVAPAETDSDVSDTAVPAMTDTDNPFAFAGQLDPVDLQGMVALIDTGSEGTSGASLIDDVLTGTHGTETVQVMQEQNADVSVFSLRAFADEAGGSMSGVLAAMRYAIDQQADIIHLAFSSDAFSDVSFLNSMITEATNNGILVVGAAGDAGLDTYSTTPGNSMDAYIVGSANLDGTIQDSSNYGPTVDFTVIADTTSRAAALFTGYVSKHGLDTLVFNDGFIYTTNYEPPAITVEDVPEVQAISEDTENAADSVLDPYVESYIQEHANAAYTDVTQMVPANLLMVKNTMADAALLPEGVTIDEMFAQISETDDASPLIGQDETAVLLYELDKDSDYFVGFANTMIHDGVAHVSDAVFAESNTDGILVDDCHYDAETGLVYVNKDLYRVAPDSNTLKPCPVQVQLLQCLYSSSGKVTSNVVVTTNDANAVSVSIDSDSLYDTSLAVSTDAGLDEADMQVSVNGIPLEEEAYDYDSKTGELSVYGSAAGVHSIAITTEPTSVLEKAAALFQPISVHAASAADLSFVNDNNAAIEWQAAWTAGTAFNLKVPITYDSNAGLGVGTSNSLGFATDANTDAAYKFIMGEGSFDILGNANAVTSWATHNLRFGEQAYEANTIDLRPLGTIVIKCAHVSAPIPYGTFAGGGYSVRCRVLVVNQDDADPYVIVAFAAEVGNTGNNPAERQAGCGVVKFRIKPSEGYLKLKKSADKSGVYGQMIKLAGSSIYSLAGAKFSVTDSNGVVVPGGLTTDANGNTDTLTLAPGYYTVTEIQAPKNFIKTNASQRVEVKPGELTTVSFTNRPKGDPISLFLYKMDGDGNIYIGPQGNNYWDGAEFEMYYFNSMAATKLSTLQNWLEEGKNHRVTWSWRPTYKSSGTHRGLVDFSKSTFLKTSNENYKPIYDAAGTATFPLGCYLIKETKAPQYFQLGDVQIGFKVEMGSGNGTKVTYFSATTKLITFKVNNKGAAAFQESGTEYYGLQIQKFDADTGKPLPQGDASFAGIKFKIENLSENPVVVNGVKFKKGAQITNLPMETDATGYAKTSAVLPNGKYRVTEVSRPTDLSYWMTDTKGYIYTIADTTGAYKNGQLFYPDNYNGTASTSPANKIVRAGLSVDKLDESFRNSGGHGDTDMSGATFAIVNASSKSVYSANGQTEYGTAINELKNGLSWTALHQIVANNTNRSVIGTIRTNAAGHAQTALDALGVGTYYVIEISPPTGYHLNNAWVGRVIVSPSNGGQIVPATTVIDGFVDNHSTRQPIYRGGVRVKKFDLMRDDSRGHGNADLAGAQFTIINASLYHTYSNTHGDVRSTRASGMALTDANATYSNVSAVAALSTQAVITTNANGDASTGAQDLPYGTYYVIETKAPTGYHVNTEWVGKVVVRQNGVISNVTTVRGGDHDTYNHSYYPTIGQQAVQAEDAYATRDQIYRGGLQVQKFDLMRDDDRSHGDTDLSNAEFTIVNASNASIRNKDKKDIPTAKSMLSANPTYNDIVRVSNLSTVQKIYTNANGDASTGAQDLPYGTYYVIETKAPTGYFVNNKWVGRITVDRDGIVYHPTTVQDGDHDTYNHTYYPSNKPAVMAEDAYATRDQIYRGGMSVQKFDLMRDDDRTHGDADLSNAEFTIINASDASIRNKDRQDIDTAVGLVSNNSKYADVLRLVQTNKYTVQKIYTDAKGDASTGAQDLPYGTYYVIETGAPYGYHVNTEWVGMIEVRADKEVYSVITTQGGAHRDYNHTYYPSLGKPATTSGDTYATRDQIYRSGVSLQKIDLEMKKQTAQGEAVLSGAEFTIINASKDSIRNYADLDIATAAGSLPAKPTYQDIRKIADAGKHTVQVIKTNAEGYAATGTYDLPYGTYYVIETKSSYGYYIDETFVGRIIVRSDGIVMTIGDTNIEGSNGTSSFVNINDTERSTVNQQARRGDISMLKVNIDGEYKPYIPFMISAVRLNKDGTETIIEQHVMVTDEYGRLQTGRDRDAATVNGFDKYISENAVIPAGEAFLKEASKWGVWFQGNADDYPKDAMNNEYGALYTGYYRITELHCEDNKGLEENLLASDLIYVSNDTIGLDELLDSTKNHNDKNVIYHPLVDTEIEMESVAMDSESDTKTLPARAEAEVVDDIRFIHVSADHKYRMETQFVDVTDNYKPLKIVRTNDEDASLSEDGLWVTKEFYPKKQSGTNNTHDEIQMSAVLNTAGLNGHTIMAVDYLYEYVDSSQNDDVPGYWILVKVHSTPKDPDSDQYVYVPDMHTSARDTLTGDRVGAKSEKDGIYDAVNYSNLSRNEQYVIQMTLKDTDTGEYIVTDKDGNPVYSTSKTIFKRTETPVSGSVLMPTLYFDSSDFADGKSITVLEYLYRADEDGKPMGEPIMVHDSLLDENQTIRWVDVKTTAIDSTTYDDVGYSSETATIYDTVHLSNVVFDDNDHDGLYTYTVKGHMVYQKDFTDANGRDHKAGEVVDTLDGTQDEVTIVSDASGNATFLYKDGSSAKGTITRTKYGMNVGNVVDTSKPADNSYVKDPSCGVFDVDVEMIYKLDAKGYEGGSVVCYEYVYHDAEGTSKVLIAAHEDITDSKQTIHFPKVRTTAEFDETGDNVGALSKEATVTDTVILTNLVPGRDYTVNGRLVEQDTGESFLVNGKGVTQTAHIRVTKDGGIVASNGEKVTVTSYDPEKNEVCGTVALVFTFDAAALEDRTCVVFEDLIHNGVKVAVHNDLTDEAQTIHFPKVRTTNTDGYTKDHVATVRGDAVISDDVMLWNLIPGETYTVNGVLMNKDGGIPLLDADGNEIRMTRTFVAGEEAEDIVVVNQDTKTNRVDQRVTLVFTFDGSLMDGVTTVAFEELEHNKVIVAAHTDIEDEEQTVHFPKVSTSALDKNTGDEIGVVGKTQITDTVRFWNLVPGMTYIVNGTLMDKETGEPLLVDGKTVTQTAVVAINKDGTVDTSACMECTCKNGESCVCGNGAVCITNYDKKNHFVDGTVNLTFDLDASALAGKTIVAFEDLVHNDITVAVHNDIHDLAQTIYFPDIETDAVDIDTNDNAGTVETDAKVVDTVTYRNLVIGRTYTISGTLMNQNTGQPIIGLDGLPITAEATFVADTVGDTLNTIDSIDKENHTVSGAYKLTFTVDSMLLAGKTLVVFEDLYHNEVLVDTHSDIKDHAQSVHYPEIKTTAIDESTGDHVGSIWGSFINGIRHLFGEKDADGNDIADDKQQNIIDTVELTNLVPGYTYVVSGKLYDVDASRKAGEPVSLVIDGKEIVQAVTITVSEDGTEIIAADGSKTKVLSYDSEVQSVNGTVDLVYSLDSSKVQGHEVVVFETLYHDVSYDKTTVPTTVHDEDIIHVHHDIEDKDQSVSNLSIQTVALDSQTESHTGVVPQAGNSSVIVDTVSLTHLVPDMEYTIVGYLVDITASDFEAGEVVYLRPDGTGTSDVSEASTQTVTFTADSTEATQVLNLGVVGDKVQGKAVTVFEDVYHNGVKISSHPAGDADGWDKESFANQTVYYPTGKTNAVDDTTGLHTSDASGTRIIKDRVYFENLLLGDTYRIDGQLMYQSDFTDANGVLHKAGDPLEGVTAAVSFTASEGMTTCNYVDSDETAPFDSLTVKEYPNGSKAVSGYVTLSFTVDTAKLAGATLVAFETFSQDDVTLFVHADLQDLPQMVRIPYIRTNAMSGELDEAAVYDEKGSYKDIVLTDTVTYENLWTQAQLDAMRKAGNTIAYEDGSIREQTEGIYDIHETGTYLLKGILMDKETGEPLVNADGAVYEMYSEPFTPESSQGTQDVVFTVNAGDFVKDGVSALEGKTVVVFEDLYVASKEEDASDDTHIALHHDIDDMAQDIRFPKVRTHAMDGVDGLAAHGDEDASSAHEVYGTKTVTITDTVSFENLHGGTTYEVTGSLQVVTAFDENGVPVKWDFARDDYGNVITAETVLDTSFLDADFDASVSGTIPLTFTFSGVNLRGKTLVAFETISREDVPVGVHADITDEAQMVYVPNIQTTASDAFTGIHEALAGEETVILDKVAYENLEYGKTYLLRAILHRKSDGTALPKTEVIGTFVAGLDDQYIMPDDTKFLSLDELKGLLAETDLTKPVKEATEGIIGDAVMIDENGDVVVLGEDTDSKDALVRMENRVDGEVHVVLPVDTTELAGDTVVVFEKLYTPTADGIKPVAEHEDLDDEDQSVHIPKLHTSACIDGKKASVASDAMTVVDTVSYEGLDTDVEYTLKGVLMDKETNTSIGVTSNVVFVPKKSSGTVDVTFAFDGTKLAGKQLVVFESLYRTVDDVEILVAEHADITDASQTVSVQRPPVPERPDAPDVPDTPQVDTGDVVLTGIVIATIVLVGLLCALFYFRRKQKKD